ncbi:NlpC/P60 family protein [Actinomadura sp. GC306]|uniref:NlpC/P60 family protein n=1 Tax=Actinomadura sp. GC306 TaxID=2530367 RepID=UPI001FB6F2B3|nr:NlpC/P60 family protein [Actinomadura sp. GC306]
MSLLAPAASARPRAAEPTPSAEDVARSEQQVRERAAEVGRTKAKLAQADGELDRLAVAAAAAVERYNGERLALQRSQQARGDALARMAAANERLEETRAGLASLAAQLYRNNTGYDQISSALVGDGGPQGFMDRAAMAEMLVKRRAEMVSRVEASRNVADIFRRQAEKALAEQQAATQRAEEARRSAQDAVARQQESVHRIEAEKQRLEHSLGAAQARSTRLKRARERASEKARAHKAHVTFARPGRPGTEGPSTSAARGAIAVRAALKWLGTPYSWGGGTTAGPSYGIAHGAGIRGFDCSGLAMYAWHKAGVTLDHWTGTQWTSGPHIPIDSLRPGDLVFFAKNTSDPATIHHVGIYVGEGQMVEAPYTGGHVRIASIHRGDLIGATRPSG